MNEPVPPPGPSPRVVEMRPRRGDRVAVILCADGLVSDPYQDTIIEAKDPHVVAVDLLLDPEGRGEILVQSRLECQDAPDPGIAEHRSLLEHGGTAGYVFAGIGQAQVLEILV